MASNYFSEISEERRLLRSHGFDRWPDGEELARRLFDVEDAMAELAEIHGVIVVKDVRGRLSLRRAEQLAGLDVRAERVGCAQAWKTY